MWKVENGIHRPLRLGNAGIFEGLITNLDVLSTQEKSVYHDKVSRCGAHRISILVGSGRISQVSEVVRS